MKQLVYTKNQFEVYVSERQISYCWLGIFLFQTSSLPYFNPSTDVLLRGFIFHQSNLMSHYGSGFQTMGCDPQGVSGQVRETTAKLKKYHSTSEFSVPLTCESVFHLLPFLSRYTRILRSTKYIAFLKLRVCKFKNNVKLNFPKTLIPLHFTKV